MKQDWINEFDAICKILNEKDLMGLIAGGAPEDEYEIEALEIFFLKKRERLDDMNSARLIKTIFNEQFEFGAVLDEEKLQPLSKAILALK